MRAASGIVAIGIGHGFDQTFDGCFAFVPLGAEGVVYRVVEESGFTANRDDFGFQSGTVVGAPGTTQDFACGGGVFRIDQPFDDVTGFAGEFAFLHLKKVVGGALPHSHRPGDFAHVPRVFGLEAAHHERGPGGGAEVGFGGIEVRKDDFAEGSFVEIQFIEGGESAHADQNFLRIIACHGFTDFFDGFGGQGVVVELHRAFDQRLGAFGEEYFTLGLLVFGFGCRGLGGAPGLTGEIGNRLLGADG